MSINSEKRKKIIAEVTVHEQNEALQDQLDALTAALKKLSPGFKDAPKYIKVSGRIKAAKKLPKK